MTIVFSSVATIDWLIECAHLQYNRRKKETEASSPSLQHTDTHTRTHRHTHTHTDTQTHTHIHTYIHTQGVDTQGANIMLAEFLQVCITFYIQSSKKLC